MRVRAQAWAPFFLEELARVDALVGENFEMFPQVRQNVRRVMLRKFLYSLIIVERGDRLQVAETPNAGFVGRMGEFDREVQHDLFPEEDLLWCSIA